jgi:hypothetical protein
MSRRNLIPKDRLGRHVRTWHSDDRAVPHETKTFRAVIDAGVALADTINRRSQSDAIYPSQVKVSAEESSRFFAGRFAGP